MLCTKHGLSKKVSALCCNDIEKKNQYNQNDSPIFVYRSELILITTLKPPKLTLSQPNKHPALSPFNRKLVELPQLLSRLFRVDNLRKSLIHAKWV